MFPGLCSCQALQVFKLTCLWVPRKIPSPWCRGHWDMCHIQHFSGACSVFWHISTPLSALFMQSVSKSWVIPLGQVASPKCYSSEPQPKANKQPKPSNLLETISALLNIRTQSQELVTTFHEQRRTQLFNSYVWEDLLAKLWDWRLCPRRDWGLASHIQVRFLHLYSDQSKAVQDWKSYTCNSAEVDLGWSLLV